MKIIFWLLKLFTRKSNQRPDGGTFPRRIGFPWLSIFVLLGLLLAACGANQGGVPSSPQELVQKYNGLIAAYQSARREASDFRLCTDTAMGTIFTQATYLQSYQAMDVEKARVWREALDNSSARLLEALANYKDANGNPIPADQLDLAALSQAGALPDGMGGGFTIMVQAFTEAPLPPISPEPVLMAMRTATEQFNKIQACGDDWNTAVERYNVERNQVPGDIVGRLAQYLGVKELPQELPYYSGDYSGSISQPSFLATPAK